MIVFLLCLIVLLMLLGTEVGRGFLMLCASLALFAVLIATLVIICVHLFSGPPTGPIEPVAFERAVVVDCVTSRLGVCI